MNATINTTCALTLWPTDLQQIPKQFNGKRMRVCVSKNVASTTRYLYAKKVNVVFTSHHTNINLKWTIDIEVKLLKHDLGLGNAFLDATSEAQMIKKKDKLDIVKIKNLSASKDTMKKV